MLMFRGSLRAGISACALIIAFAAGTSPASAATKITLAAASLEDALNALSRQSGVQILVDQGLLRGKRAPAIRSASTVETALRQLLRGSGLTWQKRGDAFLIASNAQTGRRAPSTNRFRDDDGALTAAEHEAAEADQAADIVVTGSHIARPETASPMPVNVVNTQEAAQFGRINLYDALIRDPTVIAGTSPYTSTGFGWDNGISSVSLRGLGANRTLTLLDGRRRVSGSDGTSAVDLGMIPPTMIDRVEIVTGGAAAVYGADAVTGVVNVITKKSVDGLQLSLTEGLSQKGDANEFKVTMATGGTFAGNRGSFILGAAYAQTDALPMSARRDPAHPATYGANPANTGPRDGIPDNIFFPQGAGTFLNNPQPTFFLNGQTYILDNGNLRKAVFDRPLTATGTYSASGAGGDAWGSGTAVEGQIRGGAKTFSLMARLYYPVTDSINYGTYFDFSRNLYGGTTNLAQRQDQRDGGPYTSITNPFMPADVRDLLVKSGANSIYVARKFFNYPNPSQRFDRQNFTIGQSLSGDIWGKLKWEAYYQYGKTTSNVTTYNVAIYDAWQASRNVIADPATGQPICADPAARAAGCVPFNVFQTTPYSQALINYTTFTRADRIETAQQMFGGNISGSAFALPYGDLQFTLGVESRKDMLNERGDPRAGGPGTPQTSKVGIIRQWGGQAPVLNDLQVSQRVSEAYVEMVAPVLKDVPLAQLLQIEGAYRFSHYGNGIGDTSTWKGGAIWSPFDGLSFRSVRSRSVRVPNFGELYTPRSTSFSVNPADPCLRVNIGLTAGRQANCVALGVPAAGLENYPLGPDITSGGNPGLKPETSNSLTLGMIFQPKLLPGFDLTVDYWDIDITNVIASFGAATIYNLCVDLPSTDNSFCRAQTRDPATHQLSTVNTGYINAQRLAARGVDVGARYRRHLGDGTLNVSFKGTYLLKQVTETTPGQPTGNIYSAGNWDNPHFKGTLSVDYAVGKFGMGLNSRMVGAGKINVNAQTNEVYPKNHVPAYLVNDVNFRFDVNEKYSVGAGVRNIFNQFSQNNYTFFNNTTQYDPLGRYFFVTANVKM
jgi:outer membrane receptor protein involved in Fe transport